MKRILIAGGSGMIGTSLRRYLTSIHYEVFILTTDKKKCTSLHELYWHPASKHIELKDQVSFDTIINLAGATISKLFWTEKRKKELINSRLDATTFLIDMLEEGKLRANYFVQISAIGFYGDQKNNDITEDSKNGEGFLAHLCQEWENRVSPLTIPYVIIRCGIVLDHKSDFLAQIVRSVQFKLAIIVGDGHNWISWISQLDLNRLISNMIDHQHIGVVNATNPSPIKYIDLLKEYIQYKNKTCIPIFVPKKMVLWLLGDFSELLLFSQKIIPKNILTTDFEYKNKSLSDYFKDL